MPGNSQGKWKKYSKGQGNSQRILSPEKSRNPVLHTRSFEKKSFQSGDLKRWHKNKLTQKLFPARENFEKMSKR